MLRINRQMDRLTDMWTSVGILHMEGLTDLSSINVISTSAFLAYLSQSVIDRLIVYQCSAVCCPSVERPSTFSNIFSKTARPIKAKFHMKPQWVGGTKVCSGRLGHVTKMAATLIYGKNPMKFFSGTKGQWHWVLVCSIGDLDPTTFAQMMTLGWPWPFLRHP